MVKKADLMIASRRYREALDLLDQAEVMDSGDINIYILKTDAYLALDLQAKAVEVLEAAIIQTATETTNATLDDLGGCAFRSDLAAMRHETQYTRLFRS